MNARYLECLFTGVGKLYNCNAVNLINFTDTHSRDIYLQIEEVYKTPD